MTISAYACQARGRHDIQHYDTPYRDIQHKGKKRDTQHNCSVVKLIVTYAECHL